MDQRIKKIEDSNEAFQAEVRKALGIGNGVGRDFVEEFNVEQVLNECEHVDTIGCSRPPAMNSKPPLPSPRGAQTAEFMHRFCEMSTKLDGLSELILSLAQEVKTNGKRLERL